MLCNHRDVGNELDWLVPCSVHGLAHPAADGLSFPRSAEIRQSDSGEANIDLVRGRSEHTASRAE